jgi:diketogulonate reductase-like aldo/keto reductase
MPVNCGEYTLRNGVKMPKFGLGTWNSAPGEVQKAVEAAIDAGYRHIDCAYCYGNEKEVGAALKAKMDAGIIKREDIFITSKIWNIFHRPENVETGLNSTLSDLGLEYLDLCLVHWPTSFALHDDHNKFPHVADGSSIQFDHDNAHYAECFKKMVEIKNTSGKMKAIGVSNFNIFQIKKAAEVAGYMPDVNQIENHPFNTCVDLHNFCKENNILITAYSPLGSPGRPAGLQKGQKVLMEEPAVLALAQKHNKSAAQINQMVHSQRFCLHSKICDSFQNCI